MLYQNFVPFSPNFLLRNKHFNTAYRYYFSRIKINFSRKRMHTKDGDFLDLDFSAVNSSKVIVAIHGLEGSSNSTYIQLLTKKMNDSNYDVIAVNLRSCSGEPNNLLSSYHSGKSEDLVEVIQYIKNNFDYKSIYVVGYSLGGNITLKYMGEVGANSIVKKAVAVSVPCSLKGSSIAMTKKGNKLYVKNFLKTLIPKANAKFEKFPNSDLNIEKIRQAKNFSDFDNNYTAPTHGFENADDYYEKSSCTQYLKDIKKSTLLITSLDDPFLNEACFPIKEAKNSKHFHLLTTKYGGHVGFCEHFNMKNNNWLENQILSFIENNN
jgi:predicted alpha/beta-fold hydrolase